MKKLFLLLAVLMPLLGQAKKTAPTKMRWCSFNLRVNAASDAEIGCSWESRRDRVCDWIHDNGIDIAAPHQRGGHVVADQSRRNARAPQLPCSQAATLVYRPSLVNPHVRHAPSCVAGVDDTQRRAEKRR